MPNFSLIVPFPGHCLLLPLYMYPCIIRHNHSTEIILLCRNIYYVVSEVKGRKTSLDLLSLYSLVVVGLNFTVLMENCILQSVGEHNIIIL